MAPTVQYSYYISSQPFLAAANSTNIIRLTPLPKSETPEVPIQITKIITLNAVKKRPPGTTFLGASYSVMNVFVLEPSGPILPMIIDSGSGITLISANALTRLSPRPKPRTGQSIELRQVAGVLSIDTFVSLDVFCPTNNGLVKLELEAYVVPKMESDLILGNDWADQYQLSIMRNPQGTQLLFPDQERSVAELKNSTVPLGITSTYFARHSVEEIPSLPPKPRRKRKSFCNLKKKL